MREARSVGMVAKTIAAIQAASHLVAPELVKQMQIGEATVYSYISIFHGIGHLRICDWVRSEDNQHLLPQWEWQVIAFEKPDMPKPASKEKQSHKEPIPDIVSAMAMWRSK